jgi:hypothetical protein
MEGASSGDTLPKEPLIKDFNSEREAITVNPLGPTGGTGNPNFFPLPPYFSGLEGLGQQPHVVDSTGK